MVPHHNFYNMLTFTRVKALSLLPVLHSFHNKSENSGSSILQWAES